MQPGKAFLISALAVVGAALVFLAISGRYVNVGAALGSIPILPRGGLSIAASFRPVAATGGATGGAIPAGISDPANRQA